MADFVIAGSGINALVAAALLAIKGKKVLVLERNDRIGGCIRSEEVTVPGFTHDVMATTFVLFLLSPAFGVLGPELEKRGLRFAHPDLPTALGWIADLAPRRAALIHMDQSMDYATLCAELPPGVEPCYDGLEMEATR